MQEIVLLMGEKIEGIGKINFVTTKKDRRTSQHKYIMRIHILRLLLKKIKLFFVCTFLYFLIKN